MVRVSSKLIPVVLMFVFFAAAGQGEDRRSPEAIASDRWASAYSWLQTGNNLATVNEWPLALAGYSAAYEMLVEVKVKFPEFEPKIVNYRLEKLKETIKETEAKLAESEHDVTMMFGDVIEMMELAKRQRFVENKTGESLKSMLEAQDLMEEVLEKGPDSYKTAMAEPVSRIESHILWANNELGRKTVQRSFASYQAMSKNASMVGTTEFITEKDLPEAGEEESEISAALFPGS